MFEWINDFVHLFYPETCSACGNSLFKGEKIICTLCHYHLPKTNFHRYPENPVIRQFWGKVPLTAATSLYYFNKGERVQHLVHRLKYKGDQEVGGLTGEILGNQLLETPVFSDVGMIVPVPLHVSKLLSRGYNQSDYFGLGVAKALKVNFKPDFLVRNKATDTQTRKNRYSRHENVDKVFELNPKFPHLPMHYLLVDDVITTGSTLCACASEILSIPGARVSVATLAYARL